MMTVKTYLLSLKRSHYFCFHFNDTLVSSTGHFIGDKNNSTIKKELFFRDIIKKMKVRLCGKHVEIKGK